MEIPVLQRLTDFEKASLQNPKIFSLSIFPSTSISNTYTLFKWTALILLPLIASFTTIFKSLLSRFKPNIPQCHAVLYDSDFSDDTSSISSISDDEQEETPAEDSSADNRVKGSDFYLKEKWQNRNLRRRRNSSVGDLFSLSELIDGRNVVKLWDNSAEEYLMKVWDNQVGSRIPGILAEWKPMLGRINENIYVRDDGSGKLTVGDIRMPGKTLRSFADADVNADAVIVRDGTNRVFYISDLSI